MLNAQYVPIAIFYHLYVKFILRGILLLSKHDIFALNANF